jgi:hypothetical protein
VWEKTSQRPKPTTREATVAIAIRTAAPAMEETSGREVGADAGAAPEKKVK